MLLSQIITISQRYPLQTAIIAALASVLLHLGIKSNWHAAAVPPLTAKPPQTIEVAIITPPPPPPPVIIPKPKEPPPPKPPVPVKPKAVKEKALPKLAPVVKPAPAPAKVVAVVKPAPAVKAPPKVVQKTFVKQVPDYPEAPDAKITAPVLTPPVLPPIPAFKPTIAARVGAKPTATQATGTNVSKSAGNSDKGSSDAVIIDQPKPNYPFRAKSRGIEGYVTISFTITRNGSVANPRIINAEPEGIFDEAALAAIEQWRYKPKMVNGVAVEQSKTQKVSFRIEQ